jgi:hypothetical protein
MPTRGSADCGLFGPAVLLCLRTVPLRVVPLSLLADMLRGSAAHHQRASGPGDAHSSRPACRRSAVAQAEPVVNAWALAG